MLTPEQIEAYYLRRLDPYRLRHSKGTRYRARCPIHGGNNPSVLSVDLHEGNFICFACGVKGPNVIAFETEMQRVETGIVPEFSILKTRIEEIIGQPMETRTYPEPLDLTKKGGWDRSKARDKYVYTDEIGNELFTVWRFVDSRGNKVTPPDHPCGCNPDSDCEACKGSGRVWGAKGVRRVLYRWPDVIQSALCLVVEGEKNANDLSRVLGVHLKKKGGLQFGAMVLDRIGVTTNPGGATAWKPEYGYGKEFQSKVVIKLGDNDGPGRRHDEDACKDIAPYASKLFTLPLPVAEGEDISDYLATHDADDFLRLWSGLVPYELPKAKESIVAGDSLAPRTLLVKPSQLCKGSSDGGDWLVPSLIHRGTRGLVIAPPKTGKSLFFVDIALALATRQSVLSLAPCHRTVKVGIISREDGPQMLYDRIHALARGRGLGFVDVDLNLRVNTQAQSSRFRVDNDADLKEMAEWLKMEGIEFCIIDVLNKLHGGQENSSDEMTRVMQKFDDLAALSGAQVCVIHHTNKVGGARGSSSIEGWADYIFRLEEDANEASLKKLTVRTKSSGEIPPKQMRYYQSEDLKTSRISLVIPR